MVLALYTTSLTVLGVIERQNQGLKWLIFLTNWSYTFVNLHFVTQAILACYHRAGRRIRTNYGDGKDHDEHSECDDNSDDIQVISNVKSRLPLACKVSWIIYDIAANIAFPVTVTYWSLVYIPGHHFDYVTFNAHALNSVVIVIDTMVSRLPVKLLHVIYPVIFISIYLIFSIIYWACGETDPHGKPYIYTALDYGGHPTRAAITICLFLFVGNVMSQLLLFGLYKLRIWLKRSCCRATLTVMI